MIKQMRMNKNFILFRNYCIHNSYLHLIKVNYQKIHTDIEVLTHLKFLLYAESKISTTDKKRPDLPRPALLLKLNLTLAQ